MPIIFHQGLIHAGKSRMRKHNINMEDMILFSYLQTTTINGYNTRHEYNSVGSDCTRLHNMVDNMCMRVDKYGDPCIKYNSEHDTALDFSNVDIFEYNNSDVIKGDINSVGWVIIKSGLINRSTEYGINKIVYNDNHWYNIGK